MDLMEVGKRDYRAGRIGLVAEGMKVVLKERFLRILPEKCLVPPQPKILFAVRRRNCSEIIDKARIFEHKALLIFGISFDEDVQNDFRTAGLGYFAGFPRGC